MGTNMSDGEECDAMYNAYCILKDREKFWKSNNDNVMEAEARGMAWGINYAMACMMGRYDWYSDVVSKRG
jgi:hypothetical protein